MPCNLDVSVPTVVPCDQVKAQAQTMIAALASDPSLMALGVSGSLPPPGSFPMDPTVVRLHILGSVRMVDLSYLSL